MSGFHEQLLLDLEREVDDKRLTQAQELDTLIQKAYFDSQRRELTTTYPGKWVGFVAGVMYVQDGMQQLLDATRPHPGQLYFEPIPPAVLEVR